MAFYLEHVFIVADTFLRLLLLYLKCKILSSTGTFLLFGITFFFFFSAQDLSISLATGVFSD